MESLTAASPERVLALASFAGARAVLTAVELDVFTALGEGAATAGEVADRVGANSAAIQRLLLALRALGLVTLEGDEFRSASDAARYLSRRSPASLAEYFVAEAEAWEDWGRLSGVLRSGRPLRRATIFRDLSERTERLVLGLHARARTSASAVAAALDLRGAGHLLDLGGGAGTYAIEFCRAYPTLRCTIFDLPAALRVAERIVGASEVSGRIELVCGDFFVDKLGGPYGAVFASDVLHGSGVPENQALLARVFGALRPGGRVYLRDMFLHPVEAHPVEAALLPLRILLDSERGRPYGEEEVFGWLEAAGFGEARAIEPHTLLEARRP